MTIMPWSQLKKDGLAAFKPLVASCLRVEGTLGDKQVKKHRGMVARQCVKRATDGELKATLGRILILIWISILIVKLQF